MNGCIYSKAFSEIDPFSIDQFSVFKGRDPSENSILSL